MRTIAVVVLLIVAGPVMGPANLLRQDFGGQEAGHYVLKAQDFSTIQLKSLPIVYVEDRAGTETRGRLLSITPTAIAIDVDGSQRTFAPADVTKIDRRGDSLKNGALIGAAIGLFTGMLGECPRTGANRESKGCPGARVGYVLGGAAIWAGIGAGIDALIPGRTRLWPASAK